jgi:hypothetical protein
LFAGRSANVFRIQDAEKDSLLGRDSKGRDRQATTHRFGAKIGVRLMSCCCTGRLNANAIAWRALLQGIELMPQYDRTRTISVSIARSDETWERCASMTEKSAFFGARLGVGSFRAHRQSAAHGSGLPEMLEWDRYLEVGGHLGNVDKSVFSASIDQWKHKSISVSTTPRSAIDRGGFCESS